MTIKKCDRVDTCECKENVYRGCNVIPVWYQTTDGVIKAPILGVMADKLLRPKGRGVTAEVERCTLTLPADCTYSTEPVKLTPEQWQAELDKYKVYQREMNRRLYGYDGEGGS